MGLLRIDKYLCDMNIGTRSQVKDIIKKKLVIVNDVLITDASTKVNPDTDIIMYNNKTLTYKAMEYYMLNKPQGVVSATTDSNDRTVIDLITSKTRKDLFPVGRLDKDTEGLLIITNDGELSHQLLSPKKHVSKTYYALIDGEVTSKHINQFLEGLDIGDEKLTLPAALTILEATSPSSEDIDKYQLKQSVLSYIEVTITEGRYHQVKRMFEAIGTTVVYLKRLSMGKLRLDEQLKPGEYKELTKEELSLLKD